MDTSGFYFYENNDNAFYAPNFVYARDYELLRELHDTYTYPVHGWWWFDSLEQAQSHFNTRYDFGLSDMPTDTDAKRTQDYIVASASVAGFAITLLTAIIVTLLTP